jgi:hypothetical protein
MNFRYFGLLVLALFGLISCGDKDNNSPAKPQFPIDTAKVDQFVVCVIDTIQYLAYTNDSTGGPNDVKVRVNTPELTKIFSQATVTRAGQQVVRNMELTFYEYLTKKVGVYTGAEIFAQSRTDLIVNSSNIDTQNWIIFNSTSNQIKVFYADSNLVRGQFNFKMQNRTNPNRFIDVTKGAFKIKLRN